MTDPDLPPEAVTAAAVYLHDDECNDGDTQTCGRWRCGIEPANQFHSLHARHVEYYRDRAAAVLGQGAAAIRKAERQRLFAELGNDHVVIFTEDRWTVEHSVECRLSGQMHACAWHGAVARIAGEYQPAMAGRWRITEIDSEGFPMFERDEATHG